MRIKQTIRITSGTVAELLFLLFFCRAVFSEVVERTLGSSFSTPLYNVAFVFLLFLSIIVYVKNGILVVPTVVYFAVFLLFFITILIHPEYESWYSHPSYGIVPSLLMPRAGIWAFLIVWLIKDDNQLYRLVKFTAWMMFVYYVMQFIMASIHGYWIVPEMDGSVRKDRYNLEYGYNVLLPVAFFGAEFFLNSKKWYFVPYALGVLMILRSGSRGSAIWTVIMFLMLFPFKWNNLPRKKRAWFAALLVLLSLAMVALYFNSGAIMRRLSSLLARRNISSRTVSSLLEGSFTDGNGREEIYSMAIDLIKTGGLFGHGVYGDRYVIGNFFRWGYSHNLFLELFVSFGYLGGALITGALIIGIIKLYKRCNTLHRQIVFCTFLVASCKLMLSNSFWYHAPFWVVLALMLKWNRPRKPGIDQWIMQLSAQPQSRST